MSLLPQGTVLGNLRIIDVFETFDGPRLFSCWNHSDTRYLAVWLDEDPLDTWLYLPVSEARLAEITDSRMDLRTAILEPEDGFVYLVFIQADGEATVELRSPSAIPDMQLPDQNCRLRGSPIGTKSNRQPDLARAALQTNRETIGLKLAFERQADHEGPARLVGNILITFQDLLDAIGQAISGRATSRGVVPEQLRTKTKMSVVSTYAGSFGVILASDQLPDLFGESLVGDTLDRFTKLLAAGSDRAELRKLLSPLKVRSAIRYREFLRSFSGADLRLHFDWASPNDSYHSAVISSGEAGVAARVISEFESIPPVEFQLDGILTMGDLLSQRFTVVSARDGQRITGRALPSAAEALAHATLNNQYLALIREVRATASAIDEESIRYELLELIPVGIDIEPAPHPGADED